MSGGGLLSLSQGGRHGARDRARPTHNPGDDGMPAFRHTDPARSARRLRFSRPPLKDTCGQGQPPCCLSRGCMRNGNISGCFRGIRAAQIGKTARFGHKDLGWVPAHGNHCAQEVGTGATSLSEASALLQVKSPECPRMILRTCCPIKASLPSQTRRGRGPLQR